MKRGLLAGFIILSVIIISGCITPDDIAKTSPVVQEFLAEYPNAETVMTHFTREQILNIIGEIREECDNPYIEASEFYRVTLEDAESGLSVTVWINWETKVTKCAVKKGIPIAPSSSCTNNQCTLYEGDAAATTIEGKTVTIEATYISLSSVLLTVNNETSSALAQGTTDILSGFNVYVKNILYSSKPSQKSLVIVTLAPITPSSSCTDNQCTLYEDDPITTTINGESVTLEATYISLSSVLLTVNNETSDPMAQGTTDILSGFNVYVKNILYSSKPSQKSLVIVTLAPITPSSSCTDNQCTLYEDDPVTTTLEGKVVTLEAIYVGSSTVMINVNNETSDPMAQGTTDILSGFNVYVKNILYSSKPSQKSLVIVTLSKAITCTDSDGGIDYLVKGICTDASGTYVDECFGSSGVTEWYCMVNDCESVGIGNCSMWHGTGYVCADGACVLQNQTNCTSHYEYKCYAGDVYWYNSCGNTEEIKEDCTWGCENGVCVEEPSTRCGDGICANNGINITLYEDEPQNVTVGGVNYEVEAIYIAYNTVFIKVNDETSSALNEKDFDTLAGFHVYVKNILYSSIPTLTSLVLLILGEDDVSCHPDCLNGESYSSYCEGNNCTIYFRKPVTTIIDGQPVTIETTNVEASNADLKVNNITVNLNEGASTVVAGFNVFVNVFYASYQYYWHSYVDIHISKA